jgi:4-amino-4-deoxy-L-arabinose transferase-like glycosyltransferase
MLKPASNAKGNLRDLLIIIALAAAVVAISATAPPSSHAHAQNYQIDCLLSAARDGQWLLPRSQTRGLDRKPPLYVWLGAPVLQVTGIYNDFTYRVPNVVAFATLAAMIYFLGKRWYGRRAGLLAACLWLTCIHMGKLSYMALTDMLLSLFFAGAVACADRLLFHKAAPMHRWKWAVGLWTCVVMGALSKGWGLVNIPLLGLMLAVATGTGAGFRLPAARSRGSMRLACLLVLRRWKRAASSVHLLAGLAAVAAVLAPIILAMWHYGGQEFEGVVQQEVWQRLTETRAYPAILRGTSPPISLLYYTLPASAFAVAGAMLVRPRRWLVGRSPLRLPLAWVAAFVAPFSISTGFRPDYLAPCYAAVALMAGWGIDRLAKLGPRPGWASVARHTMALAACTGSAMLVLLPLNLVIHPYLPHEIAEWIHVPKWVPPVTFWIVMSLPLLGAAMLWMIVRASLRWRIMHVAGLTIALMLGILFTDRHIQSRHATDPDGLTMRNFVDAIRPIIGEEPYAICAAENACVPMYLGRFGHRVLPATAERELNELGCRWLVTSDKGLAASGSAKEDPAGPYHFRVRKRRFRFTTEPQQLGEVRCVSERDIETHEFGRLYLIELRRPVELTGRPMDLKYVPSDEDE